MTTDSVLASHPPADREPGTTVIDDGVRRALDHRSVTLDRIAGGIFAGVLSLALVSGATIPVLVADLPGWLNMLLPALAVTVAIMVTTVNWVWPAVSHRHKSYVVSPASIEIAKGVIWKRVVSVPRSRVQHTDVTQGPLERRFDLGTLVIYTAGTEHSKIELRGLAYDDAAGIRDHLLPLEDGDAV